MNKPVVLVIMDGVGETPVELGNMVMRANTPTLDELKATSPWLWTDLFTGSEACE